jgi:hypothetical protein
MSEITDFEHHCFLRSVSAVNSYYQMQNTFRPRSHQPSVAPSSERMRCDQTGFFQYESHQQRRALLELPSSVSPAVGDQLSFSARPRSTWNDDITDWCHGSDVMGMMTSLTSGPPFEHHRRVMTSLECAENPFGCVDVKEELSASHVTYAGIMLMLPLTLRQTNYIAPTADL